MPLMIKLNRNIMKVDLCLDNGHFITVFLHGIFSAIHRTKSRKWIIHPTFSYDNAKKSI